MKLWNRGFGVLCPHLNTARFERDCPGVTHAQYIEADLRLMDGCDVVLMLPGWEHSKGAVLERAHAMATGKKVFYNPEALFAAKA